MKGERVAQLELILKSHPEGLRKSDIARKLGVHRSTVGRYIEDLKEYSEVYEENNLVKIKNNESDEQLALSVYESLALNMGAELLKQNNTFQNPHLASGLRKIAVSMQSYAPKISGNILNVADEIEKEAQTKSSVEYNQVFESLIDAWVSGKMVRITHINGHAIEETELAPYFIGFVDTEKGRNPITVTGRLRHTAEIVTIDIEKIESVFVLDETYTIPDNLKAFRKMENSSEVNSAIDTVNLKLLVHRKSALNTFRSLAHGEIKIEEHGTGDMICTFNAENSTDLFLRIVQCFDSVEILEPEHFRNKFVLTLEKIVNIYK